MGSRLLSAASRGDVKFVLKFYRDNREDPRPHFLGSKNGPRNILHAAVKHDRYTFLLKALKMLSSHPKLVIDLICQKTNNGDNPIHSAARQGNIFTLKLLVNAYTKAVSAVGDNQETPPWLAKNYEDDNPLCCSLGKDMTTQENIARYLVSLDEHLLRTLGQARYPLDKCSTLILDKGHRSIIFIGMQRGFSKLVKQILTSNLPYSLSGHNDETPLHYASKCNEQVSRLLLERHQELIKKVSSSGKTMLDHVVEDGATWLVRLMFTQEEDTKCTIPYWPRVPWIKACKRLIWHMNKDGDTALHIAARKGDIEISKLLIQGFKTTLQEEAEDCDGVDDLFEAGYDLMGVNPLYMENLKKDIPLVIALREKHDDCGVMLSMETFPLVENYSLIPLYTKCLPVAMNNGCLSSAKMILERVISQALGNLGIRLHGAGITSPVVRKMADHITAKYPVKQKMIKSQEFEKLLEVLPRFQGENQKDSKTILKEAVERGEEWFVRLALQSDKDLLKESTPAWQVACEKGDVPFLLIFVELCDNEEEFIKLCRETKQTPLHHLKLLQSEQYAELLKKPVFEKLKNQGDTDGATPLHRAIERHDLELTKALLETNEIEISIKDNNGTTALDLLENSCKYSTNWLRQYIQLLKMPVFKHLLNQCDKDDGTTPLHRAIQRDDLELTKALLETEGIDVNIKDNNDTKAIDLLQKSCGLCPSWGKMCRDIKQDSTVKKLKYLFRNISFEGMQNAMSVVAALVATITFAAGFTVPGGLDSKDGIPVLATKAAFLAFSVCNTIAMCCSIMVLFILLGPLMWNPHPSLFYANMSLFLLLMSLGGTMVAFMTGVYATMAAKAKWDAIFVIVACSLALSMAGIVLMLTYLPQFKKLPRKAYNLLKSILYNTITQASEAPIVATVNTSQQPATSLNTHLAQTSPNLNGEVDQSSSTLHPTQDDHNIEIKLN
ncbi:uncharacterized protein LOC141606516 isoform X2 [Silene latifolia]|uniref:uncharacterized protein LOC141606516 isoform X2 n=1 Tax=Silene latifolia TaxID=37657 RepID=UPI003D76C829